MAENYPSFCLHNVSPVWGWDGEWTTVLQSHSRTRVPFILWGRDLPCVATKSALDGGKGAQHLRSKNAAGADWKSFCSTAHWPEFSHEVPDELGEGWEMTAVGFPVCYIAFLNTHLLSKFLSLQIWFQHRAMKEYWCNSISHSSWFSHPVLGTNLQLLEQDNQVIPGELSNYSPIINNCRSVLLVLSTCPNLGISCFNQTCFAMESS